MENENIRNFVIIAHIDHGKSTLADRMLELTGTVESRRMRPQYLDQMDLERERGITIKMAPVRMRWKQGSADSEYILNLIDTPGHSDFSYEVSRALAAVEGAILLVDVTKGIQAQTLSNYRQAKASGLTVIGAVNKVDLPGTDPERAAKSLADLLGTSPDKIFRISGKTGQGVPELLAAVVSEIPPPRPKNEIPRALIFDSLYDDHKGILAYVRSVAGDFRAGEEIILAATGTKLKIKEVGYFTPQLQATERLRPAEIGYIATGLKEPALVKIGDTVLGASKTAQDSPSEYALPGYKEPAPVVFISFYPDEDTEFDDLKKSLERLRLADAALSFEPDSNEALGRGLKAGFLGKLHFEIVAARLTREFNLHFLTSFPSIAYRVVEKGRSRIVKDAHDFPDDPDKVFQPMISVELLAPAKYLSGLMSLSQTFDLGISAVKSIDGDNVLLSGAMPLAELIRDFDDQLKSFSAGYASFSYEFAGEAEADVDKLEILIAGEVTSALTRIVYKKDVEREGRATVEKLKKLLPAQQFPQALQARSRGRIIARETIPALKKKLGDFGKNGGDRTRKMKLWQKQKRGKEKLLSLASGPAAAGRVVISADVFREILKK